jgi:hypothetical protein
MNQRLITFFYIVWAYLAFSYLNILIFYPDSEPAIFGAVTGIILMATTYLMTKFFGKVIDLYYIKNENAEHKGDNLRTKGHADKGTGTNPCRA